MRQSRRLPATVGAVVAAVAVVLTLLLAGAIPGIHLGSNHVNPPSTNPGKHPIESALSFQEASYSTCPVGDTFDQSGCDGGDYVYEVALASSSKVTYGSVRFQVNTTDGAIYTPAFATGFAILNWTFLQMAAYFVVRADGGMTMDSAGWDFTTVFALWSNSSLLEVHDLFSIDIGPTLLTGEGYTFMVQGVGSFSGWTTVFQF